MINAQIFALRVGGATLVSKPEVLGELAPEARVDLWRELCLERVERAAGGDRTAVEIFFCLLGQGLEDERDPEALSRLLEEIGDRCWGARIFLVTPPFRLSEDLIAARSTLAIWLREAIRGRVFDLLETRAYAPYVDDPFSEVRLRPQDLLDAVHRAGDRQRILHQVYPAHRPWRCLMVGRSPGIGNFGAYPLTGALLGDLVFDRHRDQSCDLVILVDALNSWDREKAALDRTLRDHHHRRRLVAAWKGEPRPQLGRWCRQNSALGPLSFRGDLELHGFLLRLNHSRGEETRPVPLEARAVVRSATRFRPATLEPVILLTSSFERDEEEHCMAAAEDVGQLLAGLPLEMRYHVELAFDRERLIGSLDKLAKDRVEVNVWVHMGHGEAGRGLVESGGKARPVGDWLHAFEHTVTRRLGLVIFLTCESAELASRFARAGVGVGVGFEGRVHTEEARKVALDILKHLPHQGVIRAAILRGFRQGVARIEPAHLPVCKPRAYFPATR